MHTSCYIVGIGEFILKVHIKDELYSRLVVKDETYLKLDLTGGCGVCTRRITCNVCLVNSGYVGKRRFMYCMSWRI